MSGTVAAFAGLLALWLAACLYCGWQKRFVLFAGCLCGALAINLGWMVWGLQAHPAEIHALVAQAAVTLYGTAAFGTGLFAGRLWRAFRTG